MSKIDVLRTLARSLDALSVSQLNVISWAAPIISFGDLSSSRVATLGLNPSNREFLDVTGNELDGVVRRFPSLNSLGLKCWSDADEYHYRKILDSCNNYFAGNPYDGWFRALDNLLVGTNVSYYGLLAPACHLDLVPYATFCKWYELTPSQRLQLLSCGGNALGLLLRDSPVDVLILNGKSVVENLQAVSDCNFSKEPIAAWTLPRKGGAGVTGYAYTGKISVVSGVELNREIMVLGFNHNIQSSYGVTAHVKSSIGHWLTHSTLKMSTERKSIGKKFGKRIKPSSVHSLTL